MRLTSELVVMAIAVIALAQVGCTPVATTHTSESSKIDTEEVRRVYAGEIAALMAMRPALRPQQLSRQEV